MHIKKGGNTGNSKITRELRTNSLALYLGCIWNISRAQCNLKKIKIKNNPWKEIETQGKSSPSRVLKTGNNGGKTAEIWGFDRHTPKCLSFLSCKRIAGNNASLFIIGSDQRLGRGHVHTLNTGSLEAHSTWWITAQKKETKKEHWTQQVRWTASSA